MLLLKNIVDCVEWICTDTKPDGIFRQPHRMAPDQTTTLTEKLSYIFIKKSHQWNWIFPTVYQIFPTCSDNFRHIHQNFSSMKSNFSNSLSISDNFVEFFRQFIKFFRHFPTIYWFYFDIFDVVYIIIILYHVSGIKIH